MTNKPLNQEDIKNLKEKLGFLKNTKIVEVQSAIMFAMTNPDDLEKYDEAKNEQAELEQEISRIESILEKNN